MTAVLRKVIIGTLSAGELFTLTNTPGPGMVLWSVEEHVTCNTMGKSEIGERRRFNSNEEVWTV